MIICENCSKTNDQIYGSGRFCSQKCCKSFSTKSKRTSINEKVAKSLSGRTRPDLSKCGFKKGDPKIPILTLERKADLIKASKKSRDLYLEKQNDLPFYERSFKLRYKHLMEVQNGYCKICNINEWLGKPLKLQYDHINGNNSDNSLENSRLICANCHSQTETFCGKNKLASKTVLPDSILLQELLKSTNISEALRKVGLTPKGLNYVRCYKLIYENDIKHLIK